MLAAATLTVLTVLPAGVAQAGAADEPGQRVLERTLAREHHAVPAPANPAAPAAELALARTLAREQGAYPAPFSQQTANALERFRRGERASQEQTTTDTAAQAGLAQERYYSTWGYGDTPAPVPAEPSGQPDWLVLGLGVLAAALALSTGLAVLAATRANRRVRADQAA
jgi:hypothetical protein